MPFHDRSLVSLYVALACAVWLNVACAYGPVPIALSCRQPLDPKVNNACVVSEKTLWRGAGLSPESAARLVELGAQTIVSLELLHDDRSAFNAATVSSRTNREIQYFQIRDWEPLVLLAPTLVDDHIAHFLAVVRTQPKPVFVHCRSGQNRTGIMVAAYQIFNGADIEETIVEMEKYGGFWSKPDADYLRTLTPKHRAAMELQITDWSQHLKREATIRCSGGKCIVSTNAQ